MSIRWMPGDVAALAPVVQNEIQTYVARKPNGEWSSVNNMPIPFPCTDDIVNERRGKLVARLGWCNNPDAVKARRNGHAEKTSKQYNQARRIMGLNHD